MSDLPGYPPVIYAIPGAGTRVGCTIAAGIPQDDTYGGLPIYVGWNTTAGSDHFPAIDANLHFTPSQTPSSNGILQFTLSGLNQGADYVAGLSLNNDTGSPEFIGDPINFKTFHDGSSYPIEIKWAYGSCQYFYTDVRGLDGDGQPFQVSWNDMAEFHPDILWDTGDFHYQGGNVGGTYGLGTHTLTWCKM